MKLRVSLVLCLVAACGGGSNGGNGDDGPASPDAKVFMDAPANVPASFMISGKVTETGISGTSPVSGVMIALYANSDQQHAITTTMTDGQGNYAMTVMTSGAAIDGYVLATKSGYVDLYLYPDRPLVSDFTKADLNMLTPSNKDFLNQLASGNQMAGKGLIGLAVLDASGQPVAGATVSASPAAGAYRYTGSNGYPSGSATMTSSDGVAFMFNVPSGPITISATKSGMTFHSHVVEARADKFTTTAIAP